MMIVELGDVVQKEVIEKKKKAERKNREDS